MKYLKKWYINLSIQRKILYCTLGVALVVLLAASVSQYMSASSIVTEQTRKQSAGVVNELSVNLDHYFDMVRNSFEYIANNNTVQEELESDEPYKSDGTELYSYYSRSGQMVITEQIICWRIIMRLMKIPLRHPVNWRSRQKDAVFIIMLLRKA